MRRHTGVQFCCSKIPKSFNKAYSLSAERIMTILTLRPWIRDCSQHTRGHTALKWHRLDKDRKMSHLLKNWINSEAAHRVRVDNKKKSLPKKEKRIHVECHLNVRYSKGNCLLLGIDIADEVKITLWLSFLASPPLFLLTKLQAAWKWITSIRLGSDSRLGCRGVLSSIKVTLEVTVFTLNFVSEFVVNRL